MYNLIRLSLILASGTRSAPAHFPSCAVTQHLPIEPFDACTSNSLQFHLNRRTMLIAKQLKNQKVLFSIDWIASRPLGKPQLSRIEFIHDVLTTFMYKLNELYNFIPLQP